ncbi:hypothetical protein MSAN_01891100 [Mycena sanguinolenta]|uniref:Uncharacterized protein n=1 Tax=Mycena sanguinolenta TaxID=230812 RepID=A0A8H6XR01_9AGAR|nr:hypothetical protein MSAN_01891100 [Mycena sanguinolenta]
MALVQRIALPRIFGFLPATDLHGGQVRATVGHIASPGYLPPISPASTENTRILTWPAHLMRLALCRRRNMDSGSENRNLCFKDTFSVMDVVSIASVGTPRVPPCCIHAGQAPLGYVLPTTTTVLGHGVDVFTASGASRAALYEVSALPASTALSYQSRLGRGACPALHGAEWMCYMRNEVPDSVEAVGPCSQPACAPTQQGSGAGCSKQELQPTKSALQSLASLRSRFCDSRRWRPRTHRCGTHGCACPDAMVPALAMRADRPCPVTTVTTTPFEVSSLTPYASVLGRLPGRAKPRAVI